MHAPPAWPPRGRWLAGVAGFAATDFVLTLLTLPLAGCLQIGTGGDSSGGTDSGATDAASDEGATSATGALCETEPGGVVLCERISFCPQILVDPGAFPHCGFRIREGATLDLECFCSSLLCPIGVATSCASAQTLLGTQDVLLVCEQAAVGRCLPIGRSDAGAPGSACDRSCESQCAGNPDCIHSLCGC